VTSRTGDREAWLSLFRLVYGVDAETIEFEISATA